ncbi:TPA: DUF3761 domain-containing protein [Serratia marcescens]|nr:DUF3761 domain-containing protein [Serratia marcescens]
MAHSATEPLHSHSGQTRGKNLSDDANHKASDNLTTLPPTSKGEKETKKTRHTPVKEGQSPSHQPPLSQTVPQSSSTLSRNAPPEGATARCKDGSYSHSQHHRGACSRHGGVDGWLDNE